MKYIGKSVDGLRIIEGNEVRVDLEGTWIIDRSPSGYQESKVFPESVKEVEG